MEVERLKPPGRWDAPTNSKNLSVSCYGRSVLIVSGRWTLATTMNDRPTQDEIEAVINDTAGDEWRTVDWSERNAADEPARITLELEYIPPTQRLDHPRRQVKDAIDRLGGSEGAPTEEVVQYVSEEHDTRADTVAMQIEKLRTRGEIYEPKSGHLRTT